MTQDNILVIGGTGKTGRKVAQHLTALGHNVRIGSRSAKPSFDWEDITTWQEALTGMDKVYITFQPDLAVPGAPEAITALCEMAKKSNVQKLVILSGRGEKEAQHCEQIVINSGLQWSVVRADWFNQNFSESFFLDPIYAGQVALPRTEVKIPFIDTDDIAEIAVKALTEDKYNGRVLEVTGPELITFGDVISMINQATGRDIKLHAIDIDSYVEMLREHKVPESYIWLINYLFTNVLDGRNSSTTKTVDELLGRPAKSFADYATETAKTGVWNPNS
ncbi:NmrA family NAD(P)-binding protein [Roseivirga sp. E12]|uniref:NmrA family NAD(P)-binding protein n=1 Tax=Roseivirga sp. E12 TaxID=2819237 RepID=UPI001ABC2E03|nr:NmrA family NAD(P)-binding protein [Roseivirga sp. E12]MBO3697943.1 NAD(P)H-binding protein [Roseivirga sp. E12]